EAREDRMAPDRPMTHPLGLEAAGGFSEIPTELRGQGGPVGLGAVGQGGEGGRGHWLAAHAAWKGFDQTGPGSDAPEVQETATRTTEPVPEEADHGGLVTGVGQQI